MQKTNQILFDQTGRLRSGWRAFIFLFLFVIAVILMGTVSQATIIALGIEAPPGGSIYLVINAVFSIIPVLLIGWLCVKWLEHLPFRSLGAAFTQGWLKHFSLGMAVGAATLIAAVLIAFVFGGLKFEFDPNADTRAVLTSLSISFLVFAAASAFEEALFRGYILQTFSRSGLAWLAIGLTSLFFGAVHLGNPDAGVISTANTVLAGIWFSVAYLKTRDLWFVWGMHLMWNWMQGAVFGIEVSGLNGLISSPLLQEIDTGPSWLTGSTYGIEGGVACTIALVFSTLAIHYMPIAKPDPELLAMSEPPTESATDLTDPTDKKTDLILS